MLIVPSLAVISPSRALFVSLSVNKFSNKLALNVPNNVLRNLPFCTFASFLIVSLTYFVNKPDSSSDLTIFMISFISSFEIINAVIPDSNIFLWITASVADAAAVNPNSLKTLLANTLSTFFIKDNPILCKWVFDNFILADEPFAKALRSLETCVLTNNNLSGKLFSSLESTTAFDESFKHASRPYFIPDFNSLSCELDNFAFKVLYWVILY